jgi:hypothetical protein
MQKLFLLGNDLLAVNIVVAFDQLEKRWFIVRPWCIISKMETVIIIWIKIFNFSCFQYQYWSGSPDIVQFGILLLCFLWLGTNNQAVWVAWTGPHCECWNHLHLAFVDWRVLFINNEWTDWIDWEAGRSYMLKDLQLGKSSFCNLSYLARCWVLSWSHNGSS